MTKLISITSAPPISNSETKQMLSWLARVAADESESAIVRKHACVASLLMAELFEVAESTNERLESLFLFFKRPNSHSKSAREHDNYKSA